MKRYPISFTVLFFLMVSSVAQGHIFVENAMDVVIGRGSIEAEVRICPEEYVEAKQTEAQHTPYVLSHVHITINGQLVAGAIKMMGTNPATEMTIYQIVYPLKDVPNQVSISQDFLQDFEGSRAACQTRYRQEDQPTFQSALLLPEKSIDFDCAWSMQSVSPTTAQSTHVLPGSIFLDYLEHGMMHILTGYDHLLFVSALVLAARSLWDLVKVVTAFTVAHTLTLTLCVFDIVNLSERIVEPIIAASIVFVALQNVFAPKRSTGWMRLAVAFSFGLFHGLGFAGGLKDAMSEMPRTALWIALISFSFGVEIGHQIVVLPLYSFLKSLSIWKAREPRIWLSAGVLRYGSVLISLAGMYYLVVALREAV